MNDRVRITTQYKGNYGIGVVDKRRRPNFGRTRCRGADLCTTYVHSTCSMIVYKEEREGGGEEEEEDEEESKKVVVVVET